MTVPPITREERDELLENLFPLRFAQLGAAGPATIRAAYEAALTAAEAENRKLRDALEWIANTAEAQIVTGFASPLQLERILIRARSALEGETK